MCHVGSKRVLIQKKLCASITITNALYIHLIRVPAITLLGTGMALSHGSTTTLEDIAAVCSPSGPRWSQLYIYRDRAAVKQFVRRIERAGFKALFLTGDAPVLGNRRANVRNKFSFPSHLRYTQKQTEMLRVSAINPHFFLGYPTLFRGPLPHSKNTIYTKIIVLNFKK